MSNPSGRDEDLVLNGHEPEPSMVGNTTDGLLDLVIKGEHRSHSLSAWKRRLGIRIWLPAEVRNLWK